MFFHIFKYRIKTIFHTKEDIFWTLIFPLLLGTCFYAAFSNVTKATESFETISVAMVLEDNVDEAIIKSTFNSMSDANETEETPLLHISYTNKDESQRMLKGKDVAGIITFKEGIPSLKVTEEGLNSSILKELLDKYIQTFDILKNIGPTDTAKYLSTMQIVLADSSFISNKKLTDGNMDVFTDYFYSLIAMTCLFGALSGQTCAMQMKANLSALGMRKNLAPVHRGTVIFADFLATYLLQLAANAILVIYLNYILNVNLGGSFPLILLTAATGSLIGVSTGIFVGSLPRLSENIKVAINLIFSLFGSFLSGLMFGGIKYELEKVAPIINRLNPATVITDALYSLNIYDTYERYGTCMITLVIYCVVLCCASYFMTRRESYASL